MTWQETISFLTGCMPRPVGRALMQQQEGSVREIRVRADGKVRILTAGGEIACACTPTQPQVEQMAEALCEHALYARAEEQRQGFVTLRGGHRMGLCGRVVAQGQSVRALRDISSLCLRVAGQWRGAADALLEFAARAEAGEEIRSMSVGYRLEVDGSRRLQLTPTWKIVTDLDEYLVDCAKKTIIDQEN